MRKRSGNLGNRGRSQAWRDETLVKLDYYESEYRKLKEMMSLLEVGTFSLEGKDRRIQCRPRCNNGWRQQENEDGSIRF